MALGRYGPSVCGPDQAITAELVQSASAYDTHGELHCAPPYGGRTSGLRSCAALHASSQNAPAPRRSPLTAHRSLFCSPPAVGLSSPHPPSFCLFVTLFITFITITPLNTYIVAC